MPILTTSFHAKAATRLNPDVDRTIIWRMIASGSSLLDLGDLSFFDMLENDR